MDLRVANLESPLMKEKIPDRNLSPWPNKLLQVAPEEMVALLKYLSINYVSLANNHLFDYGKEGIVQTLEILKEHGIKFSGGGLNLDEAIIPAQFTIDNIKVGIFSFCEYNKPYLKMIIPANNFNYGVAPLNKDTLVEANKLAHRNDINIICLHWGKEYLFYPSPEQEFIAEKILSENFDIILGNHSHVPMKIDYINGKPVIYSHGNFIFDQFYYDKPAQIINFPDCSEKKEARETYLLPGFTPSLTLKKWGKDSKISLIAEININKDKSINIKEKYVYFDQDKRVIDFLKGTEIEHLKNKLYKNYDYNKELKNWKKFMKKKRIKEISFQNKSPFLKAYRIISFLLVDHFSKYKWFSKLKNTLKRLMKRS